MSRSRVRVTFPAPEKSRVLRLGFFQWNKSLQIYEIYCLYEIADAMKYAMAYKGFILFHILLQTKYFIIVDYFILQSNISFYKYILSSVNYFYIQELNARILNEFIEKIVVSEKEIIDGEKYQCVHIYYKFVGLMSI